MQGIIFLIFFSKSTMIVSQWSTVVLLLVPNAVFIAATIVVVTWLDKRLGLGSQDNMAVVFTSTGKNTGTAEWDELWALVRECSSASAVQVIQRLIRDPLALRARNGKGDYKALRQLVLPSPLVDGDGEDDEQREQGSDKGDAAHRVETRPFTDAGPLETSYPRRTVARRLERSCPRPAKRGETWAGSATGSSS